MPAGSTTSFRLTGDIERKASESSDRSIARESNRQDLLSMCWRRLNSRRSIQLQDYRVAEAKAPDPVAENSQSSSLSIKILGDLAVLSTEGSPSILPKGITLLAARGSSSTEAGVRP